MPSTGSSLGFHVNAERPVSPPESARCWKIYLHGSPRRYQQHHNLSCMELNMGVHV